MFIAITESRKYFRADLDLDRLVLPVGLPGVKQVESGLLFDKPRYGQDDVQFIAMASLGEAVEITTETDAGQAFEVTNDDLARINQQAWKPLRKEDVLCFERYVVNDQISSSRSVQFTARALEKIAADYRQGRQRLLFHDRRLPLGMTLDASVVEAEVFNVKGKWVKTREFIPLGALSDQDRTRLESGVMRYDSIGISGGKWEWVENDDVSFIRIDHDPEYRRPLNAREVSFVYLGEMWGAGGDRQARQLVHENEPSAPTQTKQKKLWLSFI